MINFKTISFILCITSLFAETSIAQVGGQVQPLFDYVGPAPFHSLGREVSGAGDVNGDGFADFIVATENAFNGDGEVSVYSGANGSILHYMRGPGTFTPARFGKSVSDLGDIDLDGYDDFIVGAPENGGVLVYSGATGSLLHNIYIGFELGTSVSGVGDVNNDGVPDFIAGDRFTNPNGLALAGSAYVYSGLDGTVLYQINGSVAGDRLGGNVCGAGDVNGDGFSDFIVTLNNPEPGSTQYAGSVLVYSGATGTLLYQFSGNQGDSLGHSVAGIGDINGDGNDDFMVGAPGADPGGINGAGSVFIHSGATGAVVHQIDGTEYGAIGISVSGAGDVDGDGFADYFLGNSWASPGGLNQAGSVFLYSGASGFLLHRFDGSSTLDNFGYAISNTGDVDGDGFDDLLIGAPGSSSDAGAAHVVSFHSFLNSSQHFVSASAGGNVTLNLNFQNLAGFDEYKVLISQTGVGPTTYGVEIPLTQDSLVTDSFLGNYPFPNYSDLHGTLDANGDGTASISFPTGLPSSMVGTTFWLAAIANQPGQLPEFSSVAVPIMIIL